MGFTSIHRLADSILAMAAAIGSNTTTAITKIQIIHLDISPVGQPVGRLEGVSSPTFIALNKPGNNAILLICFFFLYRDL